MFADKDIKHMPQIHQPRMIFQNDEMLLTIIVLADFLKHPPRIPLSFYDARVFEDLTVRSKYPET
jgi:hypothetical protein